MRTTSKYALSLVALGALAPASAAAPAGGGTDAPDPRDEFDSMTETPREARGVEVTEKQGAALPLDLEFRNEAGEVVTLGDYFETGKPVILTFNYSDCEMLCSLQLGALTEALAEVTVPIGEAFHIVTVAIDPDETPESVTETRAHYLERFPEEDRGSVASGWHFLVGSAENVEKLADSVGYAYRYLERRDEYIHPAALIFVSSRGTVNQYVYGIEYTPDDLSTSIMKAGVAEPQDSAGFVLSCFHYDSDAGSHADTGRQAMKYGGIAFAVLLIGVFGTWQFVRSRRESDAS